MSKDDLIKLAELAGYSCKISVRRSRWNRLCKNNQIKIYFKDWQPNKDIAQAFEVLEGWRKFDIHRSAFIKVRSDYNGGDYCVSLTTANVGSGRLPEAICQAVLKAQGEGS